MKALLSIVVSVVLIYAPLAYSEQGNWDQGKLASILRGEIESVLKMAKEDIFINAVIKQNNQSLKAKTIGKRDSHWKSSDGNTDFKIHMLGLPASLQLNKIVSSEKNVYNEAFLTDNQGANVALFPLTSDYWQGDEEKWIQCFRDGNGVVFVGPMKWVESTRSQAVQISVPVKSGGNTIGVLVVGVKLSHLLIKQLEDLTF